MNENLSFPQKVAIIAGQGSMPREIYDACIKHEIQVEIIGLEGQIDLSLFENLTVNIFPIHAVSNIINKIKSYNISNIILAGRVKRTAIPKLILDIKGAKLFTKILCSGLSDKGLTKAIISFLEDEGLNVLSPEKIAVDFIAKPGNMTNIIIKRSHTRDIEQGLMMLKEISKLDVGQSLIIQNGLILGVEAAEGTDELIKRCGLIKQKFDTEPILVKICKPNQDKRIDLPCIGEQTITKMHQYGIKGIALESHLCLILNKEKTLELANRYGIFIYGLQ